MILQNYLAAGRLVASLATAPVALAVAGLVMIATRRPTGQPAELVIAVCAGALVVCLHAFRFRGMLIRVDMPAAGRFWGTTCALLLRNAAVFTKHSELPAGLAVFLVALLRNPPRLTGRGGDRRGHRHCRPGISADATSRGFLLNIVGCIINPMWWDLPSMRACLTSGDPARCAFSV
jgi:hypothetical protein